MASYHCSVKHGTKGTGKTHADYILREGKYTEKPGMEELVHKSCGNLPTWADTPNEFFALGDIHESATGRVYSEFEIALPNELSHEQNVQLVEAFIKEHVGNKTYAYAIHDKESANQSGTRQIHAHIMFSERAHDGIERDPKKFFSRANTKHPDRGGAKKDDRFTAKNGVGAKNIIKVREGWEAYQNRYLKQYGHTSSVTAASVDTQRQQALDRGDHVAYQRLDRPAQIHLGPKLTRMEQRAKAEWSKTKDPSKSPFITDKARINFIVGQHIKFQDELSRYRQQNEQVDRQLAKTNESIQDIKKQTPTVDEVGAKELVALINKHVQIIETQLSQQRISRIAAVRQSLTDQRMRSMAQSIYTKGESKRLGKEYNDLKRIEKKLQHEKAVFTATPRPTAAPELKTYQADADRLRRWEADLHQRQKQNGEKVAALKEKLTQPEAKEKIESMIAILQKRAQLHHIQADYIKGQEEELRLQRKTLLTLKNSVVRAGMSEKYTVPPANLAIARQNTTVQEAKAGFNQLQQAIRGLAVARPKGGMNARVAKSAERTNENER